jgi:hypothetical protein
MIKEKAGMGDITPASKKSWLSQAYQVCHLLVFSFLKYSLNPHNLALLFYECMDG